MGQVRSSEGARPSEDHTEIFELGGNTPSAGEGHKRDREISLPTKNRSCTDIVCGILFIVCILLLACIAVFSYMLGDYRRIVFPKDSRGDVCGLDFPDQKYLFFFDMFSCLDLPEVVLKFGCPSKQVCVSSCPNYTWTAAEGDTFESRSKMICEGGVSGNSEMYSSKSINELIKKGICAPNISPTEKFFRRCVPTGLLPAFEQRYRAVMDKPEEKPPPSLPSLVLGTRTVVTRMIEDLVWSWKVILTCILLAAFVSFVWILLMRFCTLIMIYLTLLLFVAGFGVAAAFCFWRYVETRRISAKPPPFFFTIDFTYYFHYSTTWLVLGIVSVLILLLVLIIIIYLRKKIALATCVISEASKAMGYLSVTLFWPIFTFLLITGVIALWLFVDLNLRSIAISEGVHFANSTTEPRERYSKDWGNWALGNALKCDPTANNTEGQICQFVKQITTSYTPWLQVYNFCMCVWLINFFIALNQMTLATTFAKFYFSSQNQRLRRSLLSFCGFGVLLAATFSALTYHMGSLALGSLLITLLWLLRSILLRLERKLKTANNALAKFFLRCLCCCFWCLEKFLRFLNKNAYIVMAIHGHGFCRSARDAFGLILRNVVRVFVIEKITDYVLFVGKLAVSATASCVAYVYLSGILSDWLNIGPEKGLHLSYMIVPILVIAAGSYLIAEAFFSVYEMGVDTIFICICEDLELNDGSAAKPYFMSKSTMKMLNQLSVDHSASQ